MKTKVCKTCGAKIKRISKSEQWRREVIEGLVKESKTEGTLIPDFKPEDFKEVISSEDWVFYYRRLYHKQMTVDNVVEEIILGHLAPEEG